MAEQTTEAPFSDAALSDRCPECSADEGAHYLGCSRNPSSDAGGEDKVTPIVVDGKTGRLVTGEPLPLQTNASDDEILGAIARAVEQEAALRTIANRAKNNLQAATKRTDAATMAAAEHFARTRQLTMTFTTGGTTPEDSESGDGE